MVIVFRMSLSLARWKAKNCSRSAQRILEIVVGTWLHKHDDGGFHVETRHLSNSPGRALNSVTKFSVFELSKSPERNWTT